MKTEKTKYLILLLLGVVFWGISFPVTKMAVTGESATTFLLYRFILATIALIIIFWKRLKLITYQSIRSGVLFALPLGICINLITVALQYTSAAQCSFIGGTTIIIIPALKLLLYKKEIDRQLIGAIVITIIGLYILTIKDTFSLNIGDLLAFISTIALSVYLLMIENYNNKIKYNSQTETLKEEGNKSYDIRETLIAMLVTLTIIEFFIALITDDLHPPLENNSFWIGIVYCAIFSTAYMYSVSNIAQKHLSSEEVAIIYLLEPIIASVASYFLLTEHLSSNFYIGGSLILLGMILSKIKSKWHNPLK